MLELTELAKPVEMPCLCCNTPTPVVLQIFEAAVLAGHKRKTNPEQEEDYYTDVLNLVDEFAARDAAAVQ